MLRGKGIVRKTFLFCALLITLVTLISFGILYSAMPGHYRRSKERTFQRNLDLLAVQLGDVDSLGEHLQLIAAFSEQNNAFVLSFDANGHMLPAMTLPFSATHGEGQFMISSWDIRRSFMPFEETPQYLTVFETQEPVSHPPVAVFPGPPAEQFATVRVSSFPPSPEVDGYILSLRAHVGSPIAELIVANTTLQPIDEARGVLLSLVPYVLLSGIAIGLLFAWLYARQMTGPILKISGATQRMQLMEPDVSSGVRSDDELGLLSQNLDSLYASLLKNIEELKSEKDKATALERSKTEMLQSASHELKTPIAALSGILEGMADGVGVYKDKEKYLAVCIKQTHKLSVLVEEILAASHKNDAIEDELNTCEVPLAPLLDDLLGEFEIPISEKDLKVTRDISPVVIFADMAVLCRALSNIISNAVLYTPAGGQIYISVSERRLVIENQCEHIPQEELDRLFELFYTRSASRDKTKSGTGLGLYIARRNLERLGFGCHAENSGLGLRVEVAF